ncbi:MAG: hypothetical protein ACYCZF_10670 [Anaerolineae bacterium]
MSPVIHAGAKTYIPGMRRISWDTGEMCEFASALVSALSALGENIAYPYVMGASGAAFRFTLNPGAWDFGNYGIRNISLDPNEPIRRAMTAVGYRYTQYECTRYDAAYGHPQTSGEVCKSADLARITASIDRGVPVLAFGVVGPSDCCVITGCDEAGEVLLGWSTFQDIPDDHNIPHDPTGYFRKPDWHPSLGGYILIGDKAEPLPSHTINLDTLRWAVALARTPEVGTRRTGLAGLTLWADEMAQDAWFPADDPQAMDFRYISTTINMTMLDDHRSAEPFLRQMALEEPDLAPGLLLAADDYAQASRLRLRLDDYIAEDFSARAMQAIGQPEARRAFAGVLREIRDAEERAIGHIEQVIARLTWMQAVPVCTDAESVRVWLPLLPNEKDDTQS